MPNPAAIPPEREVSHPASQTLLQPQKARPNAGTGPTQPKSRRWLWLGLAALLIAGIAAALWTRQSSSKPQAAAVAAVKTVKVAVQPLQQTVRVAGQTSARESSTMVAPIMQGPDAGPMVLQFLVPSGKQVRKGEVVARFDPENLQNHIIDVEDQVRAAEFNILKRRAEHEVELQSLDQNLRVLKTNLDKAIIDAKAAEVRTVIDQEMLRLTIDEAQAAYKQNLADIESKKRSQAADLQLLRIEKVRADRHLARHKNDLVRFSVVSPRDGLAVVQQVYRNNEPSMIQVGDQLRPGQVFLNIVRPDRMQLQATINQSESEMFRLGQKATVRLDAAPKVTFTGELQQIGASAIAPSRRANDYIRTIPVTITIDGSHELLIPDMSAAADVVTAEIASAKAIPLSSVLEQDGKSYVWVKEGDEFQRRQVELGLKNTTHAAVLSGVDAGDEVTVRPLAAE